MTYRPRGRSLNVKLLAGKESQMSSQDPLCVCVCGGGGRSVHHMKYGINAEGKARPAKPEARGSEEALEQVREEGLVHRRNGAHTRPWA